MTKGNEYTRKRNYTYNLNSVLSVLPDFDGIAYVHDSIGKEYIKIWDTIGGAAYFDVTQMEMAGIFHTVALAMRGLKPKNQVEDIDILRSLVPLFKKEVEKM